MVHDPSRLNYSDSSRRIDTIYQTLCRHEHHIKAPGLWAGHLGTALFYLLYARHSGKKHCLHRAKKSFEQAFRITAEQTGSLSSMLREISLVTSSVRATVLPTSWTYKPFLTLDRFLLDQMRVDFQTGFVGGFSCGAISYAPHFLNRAWQYPQRYRSIINEIIRHLQSTAVYGPAACHWSNGQHYNPTLWNGQSSVILFLLRSLELGLVKTGDVTEMLFKSIDFLISQQKQQIPTDLLSVQAGDLGTGYVLFRAGQRFDNDLWRNAGLRILGARAGSMLTRADYAMPAGMLNGAAGAAVFFEHIYALSPNALFIHAAKHASTALLSAPISDHSDQIYPVSTAELSLGTGISGIGTALIYLLDHRSVNLRQLLWLL